MATQDRKPVATVNEGAGTGDAQWITRATVVDADENGSFALKSSGFGFDVPTGATVTGFTAKVKARIVGGTGTLYASLMCDGPIDLSNQKAVPLTQDVSIQTLGGENDYWMAIQPSPEDVNHPGLGLVLLAVGDPHISVEVVEPPSLTAHYAE